MTSLLPLLQGQTNRYWDWIHQLAYWLPTYHVTFVSMLLKPGKIVMFLCPLLLHLLVTIQPIPVASQAIMIVSSVLGRLIPWRFHKPAIGSM